MSFSTFLHSGGTVTHLRGLTWLALNDTAYVCAGSVVSDGGGGGTTVWHTVGTVPCRIFPLAKRAIFHLVGGAINENSTHMVRVPAAATVTLEDQLVISGGTFAVLMLPRSTDEVTSTIEVVEL
jgi:hypothetical protein